MKQGLSWKSLFNSLKVLLVMIVLVFMTATSFAQENQSPDFWSEEVQEAETGEIRRGIPMRGEPGKSREQVYYERIIRRIEPDLNGVPERLEQYLEFFKLAMVGDPRLFPFDVQAEFKAPDTLVLTGFSGFDENRQALMKYFQYLGFEKVDNQVEVLPSDRLGRRRYALVTVPHCFTYDKPEGRREPMTECLLGDPVYLLKQVGDYYLCHSSEGYVGYIAGENIRRVDAKEFTRYQSGTQAYFLKDYKTEELFIPIGARLKWVRDEDGKTRIELPSRRKWVVPNTHLQVREGNPDERIERAITIAAQMLGSRYVWSGKTSQGVDCSGLLQSSFKAVGVNLPRDAYQQAYCGALVATRWNREGLRRGDTLFFLGRNGKINHTAIYVGDGQYLEASGGTVHYTSLIPEDENYHAGKAAGFCFAKRILE